MGRERCAAAGAWGVAARLGGRERGVQGGSIRVQLALLSNLTGG